MPGPAPHLPFLSKILRADGSLIDFAGTSRDLIGQYVLDGKWRIAGASLSPSLGATAAMQLENPAASGGNLILVGVKIFTDTANPLTFVQDATSSGTPQSAFNPLMGSTAATRGVLKAGINSLTGGTALSAKVLVSPQFIYDPELFVVIPPGHALAIQYTANAAGTVYGVAHWIEP